MTTQATVQTVRAAGSNLLRYALRADAISSGAAGIVFVAAAGWLSPLLGITPPIVLSIAGILFIVYAAVLFYAAAQETINRRIAIGAVVLNTLWVIESVVILLAGWLPLTTAGTWTVAILAVIVAAFAELQFFGLRRLRA